MSIAVGVVIPIRNCMELTKAAIATIRTRHPFRVYIIDDGSDMETKAWLAWLQYVTVFTDPFHSTGLAWNWNLGLSAALNDGMTHVLVANNDILLHPEAIDTLVDRIYRGDVILVSAETVWPPSGAPQDVLTMDVPDRVECEHPDFSCFMVTADTVRRAGWFDEGFVGAYYEDNDYHASITYYGERAIRISDAMFYHYGASTVKQNQRHSRAIQSRAAHNHAYFLSKWGQEPVQTVQDMRGQYYQVPFNRPESAVAKSEIGDVRIAELFATAATTPSDISEHLPLLYQLGCCVNHIVSLSLGGGNAEAAFVFAAPKSLTVYSGKDRPQMVRLRCAASLVGRDYEFGAYRFGLSIGATDLLFLDAVHTEEAVASDLERHADSVSRYIVLHDTETFGAVGEAAGSEGIWPAIAKFVRKNSNWRLHQHLTNCNGLTILVRA